MAQPTKIPRAFAASGDKNSIPDSAGNPGFASWQEGFPQITSEPFANGGIAPKRADFNGIFNALSAATVWQQQGGVYAYDNVTDYEIGNVVEYNGALYICLVANGPNSAIKAPTQAVYWAKILTVSNFVQKGTFTPTIRGGTTDGSFTYTEQVGNYELLGDICYVNLSVAFTVVTLPSGYVYVDGLPFLGSTANQSLLLNLATNTNNMYTNSPFALRVSSNTARASLFGSILNSTGVQATQFGSALTVGSSLAIRANGIYKVEV